jgi:hypothetical protein
MPSPERVLTFAALDARGRRRSLVWRFVIRGSNVYFAPGLHFAAPEPSRYHISLHADGRCHQRFDSQFFASGGAQRLGRAHVDTKAWRRPPTPTDKIGVVVYSIGVLPDDPTDEPPSRDCEAFDMVMAAPQPGFITELQLFYSYTPQDRFKVSSGVILANHALASSEILYFLGFQARFDPRSLRPPAQPPEARANATWLGSETNPTLPPDFRGVLFCDPDPGSTLHTAIDVSVKVSPDDPRHLQYVLVTPPAG